MSTLLYQFDSLESFPVIESLSSPDVTYAVRLDATRTSLEIEVVRPRGTTGPLNVVVALPPRSVVGPIWQLTLRGSTQGTACSIGLDMEDTEGGFRCLAFRAHDLAGRNICAIGVKTGASSTTLFHRLHLLLPATEDRAQLRLISLSYSGDARLARPELAF